MRYGKSPAALFAQSETSDPAQLVVLLQGVSDEAAGQLKGKLKQHAAFSILDPPSVTANERLLTLFQNIGVATLPQCELAAAINPFDSNCWTGPSSVVKYDADKVRWTHPTPSAAKKEQQALTSGVGPPHDRRAPR